MQYVIYFRQIAAQNLLLLIKVAKGIVEPKHEKRWQQICRVLCRSLFTTNFVEFSGISLAIIISKKVLEFFMAL